MNNSNNNNRKNKKIVIDTANTPLLKLAIINELNKGIQEKIRLFTSDKNILTAALLQNPFGNTPIDEHISKNYDKKTIAVLETLNRLHSEDGSIINEYNKYKDEINLFLVNFLILFKKDLNHNNFSQTLKKEKVAYAMELLKRSDISEIRAELEDKFFSILKPRVYSQYKNLFKYTAKNYYVTLSEIENYFSQIMDKSGISARIESRLKSIYSIHKKITEKNLLFSQILDTFGIRLILNEVEECYKAMAIILKQYPIMISKIKDYISVPKPNGYQSIHLTIIYQGHPVEIQIRTVEMHQHAQYGKANHNNYKNGN